MKQDHPGRNPYHIPGGYDRRIEIPIHKDTPRITKRIVVHERNPGKYLPHVGGVNAGPKPVFCEPVIVITRQQRRRLDLDSGSRWYKK